MRCRFLTLHVTLSWCVLVATGCGGDDGGASGVAAIDTGDVVLETEALPSTTMGSDGVSSAGGTTIPLNEEATGTALFAAASDFFTCMEEVGGFIGLPSQDQPETAPVNSGEYGEQLGLCAARSQIVSALEAAESEAEALDPAEVESRNRGFIEFRDCLIGRGWQVPMPEPDEIGLLFGGSIAQAALSWQPPEGESLLEGDDLIECGTTGAGDILGAGGGVTEE